MEHFAIAVHLVKICVFQLLIDSFQCVVVLCTFLYSVQNVIRVEETLHNIQILCLDYQSGTNINKLYVKVYKRAIDCQCSTVTK